MNKQNDLQKILNALSDYTSKHDIDSKKHKEVYNAILSLAATNTNTQTTPKQNKTKKTTKTEPKKDIYDLWTGIIKSGMKEV